MRMAKYVIGIVAIVLIGIVAFYAWDMWGAPQAPVQEEPAVQQPTTATYASSTAGYSITYPLGYSVDDTYAYEGVPKKPIAGVRFAIPGSMATGTNLSADTYVSVEQLPRAQSCSGDIFLLENVKATDVSSGGTQWSVATTSGAGAGNLYEEYVYAVKGSKPCTAIRYFIHSTNIGNYEPGAVREFDRLKLLADFNTIRDSLRLGSMAPATSTATSVQ